jgi:lipopolysaccharide/colanic/teichoic acid biosynthesis glycosyltransferase
MNDVINENSKSISTVDVSAAKPTMNAARLCWRKRFFDITVALLTSVLWVPVVCISALLILILEGRPAFYVSRRRVFRREFIRLVKLRTMVRNAAQIVNRRTVPITDTRFLNISPDSGLYTRIGRWIELFHFTELPQFVHVLSGTMSIVGNRPLPDDVARSLESAHPFAEHRFDVPCGMTGPVQLIGKDNIRDEDRLAIEIAYAQICQQAYRIRLDIIVVVTTVFVALGLIRPRRFTEVLELMQRCSSLPVESLVPTVIEVSVRSTREEHEEVTVSI